MREMALDMLFYLLWMPLMVIVILVAYRMRASAGDRVEYNAATFSLVCGSLSLSLMAIGVLLVATYDVLLAMLVMFVLFGLAVPVGKRLRFLFTTPKVNRRRVYHYYNYGIK